MLIDDFTSGDSEMNANIRHFVLTPDGNVREFSADAAARVASGESALPEFAKRRLRYVQIALAEAGDNEIRVQTGVACLQFDDAGQFTGAEAPAGKEDQVDPFEYDACIQLALRETGSTELTYH